MIKKASDVFKSKMLIVIVFKIVVIYYKDYLLIALKYI